MKVTCNLSTILGSKRINQAECARLANLSTVTINALYNDRWEQVSKTTIAKLCQALDIQPGDLIKFEAPEQGPEKKKAKRR